MNRSLVLPTLLALCGVAACDQRVTPSEPVLDDRLGPVVAVAASAPARSIYSIVPD